MSQALQVGLRVGEFWDLTPREVAQTFAAYHWRQERQRERDTWLVWHIAALSRCRKLPALRELLNVKSKPLHGAELERRRREHEEITERLGRGRR